MKALYYECFSGISGDMNLGAMLDLGVETNYLLEELKKLKLDSFYEIEIKKAQKNYIYGTKVSVRESKHSHHHRTFTDIKTIIENSYLSDFVKKSSIGMFYSLAVAESEIHNKKVEDVHFHEVGAIDSIIDIVGCSICFEYLNIKTILCSRVELGGGMVQSAHGIIPIPAPATLNILKNAPISLGRTMNETTTPTGATIIASNVTKFVEYPSFKVLKTGYGIGHKDFEIPNILRVSLVELKEQYENKEELIIEANFDDISAEILAFTQEKLFEIGAKDIFTTAITTKKNRVGTKLSVLISKDKEEVAKEIIFCETTTNGVRSYIVNKCELKKEFKSIATKYGDVRVKISYFEEDSKYKAEYEDCKSLAIKHNIPIKKIYDEVDNILKREDGKI